MHLIRAIAYCLFLLSLTLTIASCGGGDNNPSGTNNPPGGATGGGAGGTSGGAPGGANGGASGGGSGTPSATTFAYAGSQQSMLGSTGQITGFAVAADGSATPLPGAPLTGNTRSLVASKRFLIGSDGTNIASYAIASNGTLSQASTVNGVAHNDFPNDSAVGTLSMDRSGNSVYASEINFQGPGNDAFAMFKLAADGTLNFLANSDISVNFAGSLTFTPDNRFAYGDGCYFLGFDVFGFARNGDGALTPLMVNAEVPPIANTPYVCPGPMSPSSAGFLALLIFSEGTGVARVSIVLYRINTDGSLKLASSSLLSAPTTVDIEFDPSGNFLAAATTAGIEIYQLSEGTLNAIGKPQDTDVSFDKVQWDNAGHLYGLNLKSKSIYIYNANQGALTPAPGSPHTVPSFGSFALASQSP